MRDTRAIIAAAAGPTLDEIRAWPATVNVDQAAQALGISRAVAYEAIRTGTFPVKTLKVRGRIRVVTASIQSALDPAAA